MFGLWNFAEKNIRKIQKIYEKRLTLCIAYATVKSYFINCFIESFMM